MYKSRILVVEDDPAIRRGMVDALKYNGHEVSEAATGPDGLVAAINSEYDLLLLDIVLPGMTGLEILERLQTERPGTPVILLTAKGSEDDRVLGLKLGADDYVVKPFSVKELIARIEAVLRRSPGRPVECVILPIPGGSVDLEKRLISFEDGGEGALTEREHDLFRYLGTHPGRVIGRDEILQRVWKLDPRAVETRTIDMTIARLR
ncbi:MAG: response regulator transcription factor, partial [Puniceicoccales bacterium]|nr:response regulator transcription factor [Puniceicoccales bacterium]